LQSSWKRAGFIAKLAVKDGVKVNITLSTKEALRVIKEFLERVV